MRRREFILLVCSTGAWPVAGLSQDGAVPVVGFLRASTADGAEHLVEGLRRGLAETGYIEGQNVVVEYRWAENHLDRLSTLAMDLVNRQVSVIVGSASTGALAAKAATSAVPIVFVTTVDPVTSGLVASLNRPGGNATGVSYLTSALGGKRIEYLHQLIPGLKSVAVMVHPEQPGSEPLVSDLASAAARLGIELILSHVRSEGELESAFAQFVQRRASALIVGADPLLTSSSRQITALAAHHRLAAIYTTADWVRAGGLMAWGVSLTDQYRIAGTYVGKILKGAKPADLPVLQPTKYELVINVKTAVTLGLTLPDQLLALADEVIE